MTAFIEGEQELKQHMFEANESIQNEKQSAEISENEEYIQDVVKKNEVSLENIHLEDVNNDRKQLENDISISEECIQSHDYVIEKQENTLNPYKKQFDEQLHTITKLEQRCSHLEQTCKNLGFKLENAVKQCDVLTREKEAMVMRYAVNEKRILEQKSLKEQAEKKFKDAIRENEILQHKVTTMVSEKARICQLLDNKCYELKSSQQEVEHIKFDFNNLETKVKWTQNSLRTEIDLRKESDSKGEELTAKLQEALTQIEHVKREAQESIKAFRYSQDNQAYILEQQLKEQQATLILLRHEKDDKEQHVKTLQSELERIQAKQKDTLQENNTLSLKVQQLERERLDMEQRLSEFRGCADQQKQDAANLIAKTAQLEQFKLQLQNEHEQLMASNEQMTLLQQRNLELESDMDMCRVREAELLHFTQQLTDKNVRLQSEFTAMETKVQQLSCEHTLLKRASKEQETKAAILTSQLSDERTKFTNENEALEQKLEVKCKINEKLVQEVADQKGENMVIKRKLELSLREVTKELQHCRKKLEQYENSTVTSSSGSNTSLNVVDRTSGTPSPPAVPQEQVKVVQPEQVLDKQTLIEHIVKLQRVNARKSEKLDFMEEHVNTLVTELQRKTRLLQSYIMREQAGTMSSNKMDNNKAHIAKLHGVMASVYGSRVADDNLTLELSLDINRKLQAVLEDALLKNITLKENVDTLGGEIDRLNRLLKS